MLDFLLSSGMAPFSGAILFVAGLVALELIALLMGGSLMGMDADGAEIDVDLADAPDFDLDADFDAADFDVDAELDMHAAGPESAAAGPLGWFGLGEAPIMVWVAGVATAFGVTGYVVQLAFAGVFGAPGPASLAVAIAVLPGLIGGRFVARAVARLAPKTETSAVSRRHLGGRLGVITQGTAEAGRPAECRITDRHGNTQYVRVVPLKAGESIPQGGEVIVLRPEKGVFRVIRYDGD